MKTEDFILNRKTLSGRHEVLNQSGACEPSKQEIVVKKERFSEKTSRENCHLCNVRQQHEAVIRMPRLNEWLFRWLWIGG